MRMNFAPLYQRDYRFQNQFGLWVVSVYKLLPKSPIIKDNFKSYFSACLGLLSMAKELAKGDRHFKLEEY